MVHCVDLFLEETVSVKFCKSSEFGVARIRTADTDAKSRSDSPWIRGMNVRQWLKCLA